MRETKMNKAISKTGRLLARRYSTRSVAPLVLALSLAGAACAATPGITGPTFKLIATDAHLNQPDGAAVYSWGYGCNGAPTGFRPKAIAGAFCSTMQVPGPTHDRHSGADGHGHPDQ